MTAGHTSSIAGGLPGGRSARPPKERLVPGGTRALSQELVAHRGGHQKALHCARGALPAHAERVQRGRRVQVWRQQRRRGRGGGRVGHRSRGHRRGRRLPRPLRRHAMQRRRRRHRLHLLHKRLTFKKTGEIILISRRTALTSGTLLVSAVLPMADVLKDRFIGDGERSLTRGVAASSSSLCSSSFSSGVNWRVDGDADICCSVGSVQIIFINYSVRIRTYAYFSIFMNFSFELFSIELR